MPDSKRLETLAGALDQMLASGGSEAVVGSIRRIAMALARDESLDTHVQAIAARLSDSEGEAALEVARELQSALHAVSTKVSDDIRQALVVEADDATAETIIEVLEAAGWQVERATRAKGAVDRIDPLKARLVVVDVFLPDRDGRDLVLDLSEHPSADEIRVVVVAPASPNAALAETECLALGADRYLRRDDVREWLMPLVGELFAPDPEERQDVATRVLKRSELGVRYSTRVSTEGGGAMALVHLTGLRTLAEAEGARGADLTIDEISSWLRSQVPEVETLGRWDAVELVLLLPGLDREAARARFAQALARVADHPWTPRAANIVHRLSVAVVDAPRGAALDQLVRTAGRARIGLDRSVPVLYPAGHRDLDSAPCVVVVEDDAVTRALVVHKLRHAGYDVTEFADGNRASKAFEEGIWDLYLLDINLPGKDGFALIREIRGRAETGSRPVLVLSALGSDTDVVRGLDLGADDYMMKPFSPVELTARVRRLMNAAAD